jgi:hypothetical protein
MSDLKRIGDLEIAQDMPHQRLAWKIERVGWLLMALLLLAALVGLLGPGLLSDATAGQRGSALSVEYSRFERYQSPNQLRVQIGAVATQGGKANLWFNREFIENIELRHIDPEPENVEAAADRFTYSFNLHPGQSSGVTLHFEPNKFGHMPIRVGTSAGAEISFWQFYYP